MSLRCQKMVQMARNSRQDKKTIEPRKDKAKRKREIFSAELITVSSASTHNNSYIQQFEEQAVSVSVENIQVLETAENEAECREASVETVEFSPVFQAEVPQQNEPDNEIIIEFMDVEEVEVNQENHQTVALNPEENNEECQSSHSEQNVESEISEVSDDPEYIDKLQLCDTGRSKKRGKRKQKMKELRHTADGKCWIISCNHTADHSFCKIQCLEKTEIDAFFTNLYDNKTKINQDKYLLNFMQVTKPKRLRRKDVKDFKRQPKNPREDRVSITYHLKKCNGENIPVCSKTFETISNVSRNRLNMVAKRFFLTQKSPMEARGGNRSTERDSNITQSIVRHIETFKCKKSHYIRKDTGRTYLQPDLTVRKIYKLWRREREKNKEPIASYSKFYYVFTNKFNIGFGHPRQDVCSYCTEMKIKVKNEHSEENKVKLSQEYSIHKIKAKKFFQLMKEKSPGTISVSFDMMQNQPLPKLNVTDVFYSRQIWLYNLTFVICSDTNEGRDNCFLYTWLETEAGRGPNEVCSCLADFLDTLEKKLVESDSEAPHTLRLFSDSCSAQNKNMFVMTLLTNFVNKSKLFKKIEHYFPIRGHSYMPADRTFGRIEKCLRKKTKIISPTEYHHIFSKFANVKVYGKDFVFYDYKTVTKILLKTLPFKTTQQKVFTYLNGKVTVGVSQTYSAEPVRVSVAKKGKNVLNLKPLPQPKESHVKDLKRENVRGLLKYVDIPEDAIEFYNDVLFRSPQSNNNHTGTENPPDEYDEDDDIAV